MRKRIAGGLSLYNIFWIFMLSGILGCFIETIWCYFIFGELSSRTSNLFLPFSSVWGLGCALFSILLHRQKESRMRNIFIRGYLFGGAFEFLCGIMCQLALGVTFWDYSGLPLSIGNYVNLVFCAFWGLAAVVWAKWIYPWLAGLIERVPQKAGMTATWCMIGFMFISAAISGFALVRMSKRHENIPASNRIEAGFDRYLPDQVLAGYFPKMKYLQ